MINLGETNKTNPPSNPIDECSLEGYFYLKVLINSTQMSTILLWENLF